ncbi:UbiA prenyltransferase family-domain-containing protein [Multifurca ochricompacta]|uniref:Protoheme IX farnesyltransferase, mitochondrial n=1 Tax=Multifurca ochricompacta TaxID=376703 RepID=A0AAD4M1V2_9AGAM|nr:UbiA prenyltransferase family-domain-containing protein [Multifurca ochricompacta]
METLLFYGISRLRPLSLRLHLHLHLRHSSATQQLESSPASLQRTDIQPPPPIPLASYRPIPALTPTRLVSIYAQLSKARLSSFNVLVAMSGVALSPIPTTVPVLLSTALGTALCSASANTLNQLQEVPYDAQMARTRGRPLVRRALSPTHAAAFAAVTGLAGPVLLWTMCNPTTAFLGAANIALYAGPYTWMKRRTIWNTWVGAIVGAVPPLMGWAAVGGTLVPSAEHPITFVLDNPLAPWALFALMFSWQFPHFNSLAHFVRGAYAQGGYRMLAVLDPRKNRLVALRHPCSERYLGPRGVAFNKFGGDARARTVFMHSLWWLPVVLGLMIVHKNNADWLQWIGVRGMDEEERVRACAFLPFAFKANSRFLLSISTRLFNAATRLSASS